MTTATPSAPAASRTAASIARRVDFPTWLPAMLVKELRQGLRARGFVGTLVGFQVVMTLFTVFAIAGGTGSGAFGMLQGAYWVMLNVQLLIITPGRAMMGLQGELDARSLDLLMLTRLTAWRVVLGKWISLLVQAALLVIAMLPYGVARYFFGSVDLAGEAKLIALIFVASGMLTAAALWSSAWPKVARIGVGIGAVFTWQLLPGSVSSLMSIGGGRPPRGGGPAFGFAGAEMWLVVFDACLILLVCLVGAVRRLAPRAENPTALMRCVPVLALLPVPLLGLRLSVSQIGFAGIVFALIAALELARAEEPMAGHWRAWARFGFVGRGLRSLFQPGWASAMEYVLVAAALTAAGGFLSNHPWKVAQLSVLAAVALIFPALLLTWMSAQFTQRAAGYVLVLGGASLIAAVAAASASVMRPGQWADVMLLVLPISSFWSSLGARTMPGAGVLIGQGIMATTVLGLAWWRARPYRRQRDEFDEQPAATPEMA